MYKLVQKVHICLGCETERSDKSPNFNSKESVPDANRIFNLSLKLLELLSFSFVPSPWDAGRTKHR